MSNMLRGKIAVTGTGRCRTTFIMRFLTALDPQLTGFKSPTQTVLSENQAGMERVVSETSDRWDFLALDGAAVWKDPGLPYRLPGLIRAGHAPAMVVVPVRPLREAAESRLRVNRPWFPDHPEDLANVPRERWPEWVTVEAQERVMEAELGRLFATCALARIPVCPVGWGDFDLGPEWFHGVLEAGGFWDAVYRHTLAEYHIDQVLKAWEETWNVPA